METKQKISIPLPHEVLRNQISQTLHEFSVLQLHVFSSEKTLSAEVFILMKNPQDAETLRARKWIARAADDHIIIHISYVQKAEFQLKCGNPFYQYYADPSAMVWMNEEVGVPLKTHSTKKAFKKKLNVFKEKFYHDHDLLMTEAHKFHSGEMYSAAFQNYLTLLEHHVEYLENLYMGCNFFDQDLHTRLKQLMRYIPEIQKVFVMKNENTFYLIGKMEESVREAEGGGESDIYSELYGAVKSAEAQLYKMVADRFSQFTHMIRFNKKSPQIMNCYAKDTEVKDHHFENVLKTIITKLAPEEIYLFHRKEICSPNPEEKQCIYYLLVIGDGIGNSAVQDIQQSVSDTSNGRTNIIILGHSRIYIQNHLSTHQQMMKRMITDENKVYQSSNFHPTIHWQDSVWENDWEFDMQYRTLKDFVAQYFNLRNHLQNENHCGLVQLFSNSIMRLLRIYIYAAFPYYMPHYISAYSIWKLCIYADPSLEKIEFLFEKLSTDFYWLIDYYIKYSDSRGRSSGEELIIMDEILNILTEKLDHLVKEKNLIAQST
ncbi:hypothetical protein KSK37_00465 [Kaistella sp. DKR-2]|uniref:hypothetical protein n=1 Tax=Kaistella soli TaxID=2849654 RepID=UPI001C25DCA5|nr:hypothetical protein [Kaistella soli]MBU8881548.1 hypothetical protein [Kaistella soli]